MFVTVRSKSERDRWRPATEIIIDKMSGWKILRKHRTQL
jgi:hypothetical protein